jgi:hypothetical protein
MKGAVGGGSSFFDYAYFRIMSKEGVLSAI